jgi:hypothetical protein
MILTIFWFTSSLDYYPKLSDYLAWILTQVVITLPTNPLSYKANGISTQIYQQNIIIYFPKSTVGKLN